MRQNIIESVMSPEGEVLQYVHDGKYDFLQSQSGLKYTFNEGIICFLDNVSLSGNNKKYQKMYDNFSWFYDIATRFYAQLKSGNERNRVMQYLSLLNIKNDDKVIEISIGTGRNIKYLNPLAEYFGVDISLGMLKRCQHKMRKLNRAITLIQAEAEFLPLKDESFDVIFSAGGFNFVNDPGRAVIEMLRIAKSGKKLLITDETENFRLKHSKSAFYSDIKIKNPVEYLPDFCKDVEYKEICNGDLYVLTFLKP